MKELSVAIKFQALSEITPLVDTKERHIAFISAVSLHELKHLVCLSYPVILTFFLEWIPGVVSLILVGHINSDLTKEYIDGAALAVMYVNLTAYSIGFGLATAMDTLCSQAFGAGKPEKLGEYFLTGLLVLSVALIPMFIANYFCTTVLVLLGQHENVAILAGTFAIYSLPGLPFLFLYELIKKVLQAQNIVLPMTLTACLGNIINAALGYVLVYHSSLGFIGAAVARSVANATFPLMIVLYLYYSGRHKIFLSGLHLKEALAGVGRFVALGLPGMLMMCFEWWAFEMVTLLSGLLPDAEVCIGANAILINISSTIFMLYLGISVAVNVRVGNHLGASDPDLSRITATWGIIMAFCAAVISAFFLVRYPYRVAELFTDNERIRFAAAHAMILLGTYQIVTSINAAIQGVFRGSGRQLLGAQINFVAYYILGIPLGCFTAFIWHWGIMGLWSGITIGLSTVCIVSLWVVYRSDWTRLASEAKERVTE